MFLKQCLYLTLAKHRFVYNTCLVKSNMIAGIICYMQWCFNSILCGKKLSHYEQNIIK